MKAILISIKPKYIADILNGKKTIEIRKTIPKCNLPIDVYIYCTKNGEVFKNANGQYHSYKNRSKSIYKGRLSNGVVVAKFTLNKVEEQEQDFYKGNDKDFYKHCCLQPKELFDYIGHKKWYAWHIDNLEIFDKPLLLNEHFYNVPSKSSVKWFKENHIAKGVIVQSLLKAPQSWQFVEVDL